MPLVKKEFLVIAFAQTADAMALEAWCTRHGLPGRLIPLPREISAGCGLSWRTEPELKESLTEALAREGLRWETMRVLSLRVFERDSVSSE